MKRRLLVLLILGLFIIPTLIQGAEPELKTIIIEPPPGAEFKVDVWTDKGDNAKYNVGEKLIIYFKVTQDAYVYIWDINANGEVRLIFPNKYNQDNFVRANIVYSIPSSRDTYSLKIAPPAGREVIHILASKTPISTLEEYKGMMDRDPFPLIPQAPEIFTDKVKRTIEIVPTPTQWTTDNAIFYVAEGPTSTTTGRLIVESNPRGASITLDGRSLGYTPYDGQVPVGRHTVRLDLAGYQPYTTEVNVTPNKTAKIEVKLNPILSMEGEFNITSIPSNAEVFINGERKGKTTLRVKKLKPGRYQVTIIKPGYETFVAYYEVFPGQTTNINISLNPIR